MGRLLGKLLALFAYFCVATVIAAAAGVVQLRVTGRLDDNRIDRIVAALQGNETKDEKIAAAAPVDAPRDPEQPSYEERERTRDIHARNLELREQALKSGLERVRFEKDQVTEDRDRYKRLQAAFEEQLNSERNKALSQGSENVRQIWENIKPKQAKEQILQMIEKQEINDVVSILSAMPIGKRAEIVAEFKTSDETAKLDEIMRLIRLGVPEVNLIDKTRSQIK